MHVARSCACKSSPPQSTCTLRLHAPGRATCMRAGACTCTMIDVMRQHSTSLPLADRAFARPAPAGTLIRRARGSRFFFALQCTSARRRTVRAPCRRVVLGRQRAVVALHLLRQPLFLGPGVVRGAYVCGRLFSMGCMCAVTKFVFRGLPVDNAPGCVATDKTIYEKPTRV